EPTSRYLPNIDSHRPHRTGATASVPRAMKVADSLTASKSKSAPDRPTIRLASDVTPAAIVTTAGARRCRTSSCCAIIPLLLGPHAANLRERPGLAGFTFLRAASARTSHGATRFGHLVLSNIERIEGVRDARSWPADGFNARANDRLSRCGG